MTQPSRVLATRCPHCHTVFRVVADQLKLRDGLVRCGNCREVFDGRVYLCEPPGEANDTLPADAMRAAHADTAAHTDATTTGEAGSSGVTGETQVAPASLDTSAPAPEPEPEPAATASAQASTPTNHSARPADRHPVPEMLTPEAIAALLGTSGESRSPVPHGPGRDRQNDPTALTAPTTSTPQHDEAAVSHGGAIQARRSGVGRAIWRVLIALAVLGLLAQWAWIERAALVDRVPALRDVLTAIGRPLHVAIAPPRQPDMIQLSSVTLVTGDTGASGAAGTPHASAEATASAVPGGDAADTAADGTVPMTLTVFLRNQADYALAWPSLELTLSDIDGKPVVRRAFAASDYVADATLREAGLAPHSERTIRLRLSAQAALASNYRVLAFYP